MSKSAFIHFGVHKTGSSAVQNGLNLNADLLFEHNLYVPKSGRIRNNSVGNHHNIAMELSDDRDFKPFRGKLIDPEDEIGDLSANIILSSEYFSHLIFRPKPLERLKAALVKAGFKPLAVIFLREQVSFFNAVYSQFCYGGFIDAPRVVVDDVLANGRFRFREWTVPFDPRSIFESLSAAGFEVRFVNYHQLQNGDAGMEFLKSIGAPRAVLQDAKPAERLNENDLARSFKRFVKARERYRRPLDSRLTDKAGFPKVRPELSEESATLIRDRFEASNIWLRDHHNVDLISVRSPRSMEAPVLEEIYGP